jgi:hypothetical protein
MNFATGLIMGTLLFIVIAYAIIFNVIDHQLDDLRERINDLEDEVYGEEDDDPCDSDDNPIILIDDDDEDLEEGDT